MKNEVWTKLFGFEVGRELKEMVLAEVATTGEPIEKVIARYTLSDMGIMGKDNRFDYNGKRITVDEYKRIAPLGPYAKLVIIKRRE